MFTVNRLVRVTIFISPVLAPLGTFERLVGLEV